MREGSPPVPSAPLMSPPAAGIVAPAPDCCLLLLSSPSTKVNPHIIPFEYHNRGRDGRPSTWRLWAGGWRGGFVLSALELWLKVHRPGGSCWGCVLVLWLRLELPRYRGGSIVLRASGPCDQTKALTNLSQPMASSRQKPSSQPLPLWRCVARGHAEAAARVGWPGAARRLLRRRLVLPLPPGA